MYCVRMTSAQKSINNVMWESEFAFDARNFMISETDYVPAEFILIVFVN